MLDARDFYARNPQLRDGFAEDFLRDQPQKRMQAESVAHALALLTGVGIDLARMALPAIMRKVADLARTAD